MKTIQQQLVSIQRRAQSHSISALHAVDMIERDARDALAQLEQVHELLNQGRDHEARRLLGGWPPE